MNFAERLKKNFVLYLLIFIAGSIFGSLNTSYSIGKDCSVMRVFRIANVAHSCQRLAP